MRATAARRKSQARLDLLLFIEVYVMFLSCFCFKLVDCDCRSCFASRDSGHIFLSTGVPVNFARRTWQRWHRLQRFHALGVVSQVILPLLAPRNRS